jgi:hypothetical protein
MVVWTLRSCFWAQIDFAVTSNCPTNRQLQVSSCNINPKGTRMNNAASKAMEFPCYRCGELTHLLFRVPGECEPQPVCGRCMVLVTMEPDCT